MEPNQRQPLARRLEVGSQWRRDQLSHVIRTTQGQPRASRAGPQPQAKSSCASRRLAKLRLRARQPRVNTEPRWRGSIALRGGCGGGSSAAKAPGHRRARTTRRTSVRPASQARRNENTRAATVLATQAMQPPVALWRIVRVGRVVFENTKNRPFIFSSFVPSILVEAINAIMEMHEVERPLPMLLWFENLQNGSLAAHRAWVVCLHDHRRSIYQCGL